LFGGNEVVGKFRRLHFQNLILKFDEFTLYY